MTNKKVAIVLGGTNPHKELIERLKKRGFYTVLIDYLNQSPAKLVADEHVQESALDKEVVLEVAREKRAELVISPCVDHANVIAAYVSEKLGLPTPYSYETAKKIADKTLMKEIMLQNNIPTAKHQSFKRCEDLNRVDLKFPLVVKPSDTGGSKGVKIANDQEELYRFAELALSMSRNRKGVAEEFIDGMEFQASFFVHNHEPHLAVIAKKHRIYHKGSLMMQSFMGSIPAEVSRVEEEKILNIAKSIVGIFNLNNTALIIQGIIRGDEVYVIEFAPRIGGGLSYKIIEMATGMNILEQSINALTSSTILIMSHPVTHYFAICNLYANEGVLSYVEGLEELHKGGFIEEYYLYRHSGDMIGKELVSRNRIAAFILKSESREALYKSALKAVEYINIYIEGEKESHRKEIYSHLKEGLK